MLCKPFTSKLEQTQLHDAEGHNALDVQYFIQLIYCIMLILQFNLKL